MNGHQLEARAAKAKADSYSKHIDMLNERIDNLKRTVRMTNEVAEQLRTQKLQLEDFVRFAEEYYPGCVAQYNAIKKLEGENT